ncbi:glycosyltransferase family 4 protein [Lutimonas zeaxanthinifaciens]|uniref:glycosyltransferase family 4 protein n=1 Tax=Lutimonas zeaxanthinifaciens TaxID=3060215 RepID=UPI00265CB9EB|nr:MraY family glycosyltransferase [Lutimonas sp. YSD2104]WKK66823.1 MraY family glycosyltransferase [Lutimonas sp. YSD2104]
MKNQFYSALYPEDGNMLLFLLFQFFVSFLITILITPKLIRLVVNKNIGDKPNERSSHKNITPTLGGIAFFISLTIGILMFSLLNTWLPLYLFLMGLSVLFITGLIDDIRVLSAKAKLIAQILAISIVLIGIDLDSISLHGFMGFEEIPSFFKFILIYGTFIIITNAINLIDGIDGLAALLGIIILGIFTFFFFNLGSISNMILSVVLMGSLSAFLFFNLSKKRKIFMGDTGSMIIGFVISYLTINFLSLSNADLGSIGVSPQNAVYFLIGMLFIPLLDVVRVFTLRIMKGLNPFKPDRTHIHHVLIDCGLSHAKSSLIISVLAILNVGIIFTLGMNSDVNIFVVIMLISAVMLQVISFLKNNAGIFNKGISLTDGTHKMIEYFLKSLKEGASVVFRSLF